MASRTDLFHRSHGQQPACRAAARTRIARPSGVRDACVVDGDVKTSEFAADARRGSRNGVRVRYIQLKRMRFLSDLPCGRFAVLQASGSDKYGEALLRQLFGDLGSDSFVGSGDQRSGLIRHGRNLLFGTEYRLFISRSL